MSRGRLFHHREDRARWIKPASADRLSPGLRIGSSTPAGSVGAVTDNAPKRGRTMSTRDNILEDIRDATTAR